MSFVISSTLESVAKIQFRRNRVTVGETVAIQERSDEVTIRTYTQSISINVDEEEASVITVPDSEFSFGVNLSGFEYDFPSPPPQAELAYWKGRGVDNIRLPFSWAKPNSVFGTTGMQPLAYGPLDTTSTYVPFIPDVNLLQKSDEPATPPWQKYAAAGTLTITNNYTTGPNGHPAALVQASRPDTSSYFVIPSPTFAPATLGATHTGGLLVKANDVGSVGKTIKINFYNGGGSADQTFTLTADWQLVTTSGSIAAAGTYFQIFPYGGSATGDVNFLISEIQVNAGATRLPYEPTYGGYVRAMDQIMDAAEDLDMKVLLDLHMFGGGPGIDNIFPISQLTSVTSSGNTVTALYSEPLEGLADGTIVAITGAVPVEYNGFYATFNVTGSSFQYTTNSTPTAPTATGAIQAQELGTVGAPNLPISAYVDFWTKVATRYKDHPALLGFDIMNEWVNGFSSSIIFEASQAVITAIRGLGYTGPIHVEGTNYSGVWNWVSGQGQPYNNSTLYQLEDPADNLFFHAHTYFDNDSSGSNFSYANEIAKPGVSPPGSPTGPNIGVERMTREYIPWGVSHGAKLCLGEFGVSYDPLGGGGNDNWQAWATIARNTIDVCEEYNIPVFLWGAGPGFGGGYGFNPEPISVLTGAKDYTSNGLQSVLMAGFIDYYTGYDGAQPTAYRIDSPLSITPNGNFPAISQILYGEEGLESGNFTIRYGGKITTPVTIFPFARLSDSFGAGTFDPSTVTLSPGDNAIAYFKFTPGAETTYRIGATNNAGWTDPPTRPYATSTDQYRDLTMLPTNLYGMYRRLAPYVGPCVRLRHPVTSELRDWYFNDAGNLDRGAIQTWAGVRSGIPVTIWYDQSPSANHWTLIGTTLNLENAAGYPDVVVPFGATGSFNTLASGKTKMSVLVRMNQGSTSSQGLFRQDYYAGPIIFSTGGLNLYSNGYTGNGAQQGPPNYGAINTTASVGAINNAYHEYANTYSSGVTNGFKGYRDGSQVSQTTVTYAIAAAFTSQLTQTFHFKFGSGNWTGALTNLEIFEGYNITAGEVAAITSADTTYYSTPLPETLPALAPTITGYSNQTAVSGVSGTPFSTITIGDLNTPSPTDTVTITLSGHAATLSGTGLSGSNPYTLSADTPANITTKLRALSYLTTGTAGNVTNIGIVVNSSFGTSANVSITDTISTAAAPVISGMVGPNVSETQGAPPLWQITVTDANPTPAVSASIAVSGDAGTMSKIGPYAPSGSGPYTFSAMSPAELTRALKNLLWLPSVTTPGAATTFTVTVTNALGSSVSASNTITSVAPAAMPAALTPVAVAATLPQHYKGLNFPGGEFGSRAYPLTEGFYSWAAGEGFKTVRFPFLFSRTNEAFTALNNSTLFRNFNSGDLSSITAAVEYCRKYGLYILIDDHSYGGILNPFPTGTADDSTYLLYGSDIRTPKESLADLWKRAISYYQNYPNVILGLQNEPGWNANSRDIVTAAVAAIRSVSATVTYTIPGRYSNVSQFDYAQWNGYADPDGGPFMFEVHRYFDADASGTSGSCNGTTAAAAFDTFTNWCRSNGYYGFVGEWAYGNDASCAVVGPGIPAYFTTNDDVYLGWTWWAGRNFGSGYHFYIGDPGGADTYQVATLQANLGNTF